MRHALLASTIISLCAYGCGDDECALARAEAQAPWEQYVETLDEAHQSRASEIEVAIQAGLAAAQECRERESAPRTPRPETGVGSHSSPAVSGSLGREAIRGVITSHTADVRACYQNELRRDPSLGGRVTVSFIVSPTGSVESPQIATSTMGNEAVESCITTVVGEWSFPAPEGGSVVVNYPFTFSADEQTCSTDAQVREEVTRRRPELPDLAQARRVSEVIQGPATTLEGAWRSFRDDNSRTIPDGPPFREVEQYMDAAVARCLAE